MSDHEDTSAPELEPEEKTVVVEIVDPILGSDPWMRFDMWTSRLWECVENAKKIAEASDPSTMSAATQASFCAAQFAHEVAELVNPLALSPNGPKVVRAAPSDAAVRAMMDLLSDDGDD